MNSNYRRITLYFKLEDEQDSLRYAFIGSLGRNKKAIIMRMIDRYLQDYGIENLEDLTLKDLQKIKQEIMGVDPLEKKEKRPRGRPKKNVELQVDVPVEVIEEKKEVAAPIVVEKVDETTSPQEKKPINPMVLHVELYDEDDDAEDDENEINVDLFSQLGAFGGGR